MIKLIVTDMDGCFLNDKKQLHPQSFELIQQCLDSGVHFAVASGRSALVLKEIFSSVLDKISIICDNGALVSYKNEPLHLVAIDEDDLFFFIQEGLKNNEAVTILSTPELSYIQERDDLSQETLDAIGLYYPLLVPVPDLLAIKDNITKISYYDANGTETGLYPKLAAANRSSAVLLSAAVWVDVINPGANKGKGVATLQKHLNISPDETAVFGDYLNDFEMIQGTKHSFAPQKAHPEIKRIASKTIGDNNDWSVYETIKQLIK